MAECYGVARAFQHPDVVIGWGPFVAIRPTEIRTNPGAGTLLKTLPKGGGMGYQSVRNPTSDPSPPLRLPVTVYGEKYAWVYSRAGTQTGWVKLADIAPDPNSASKPPLLGPGGWDFEIDRTPPRVKKPNNCGKLSATEPLRQVQATEVYLRYSARGTAFHYLHEGDVVKLLIVNAEHKAFAFVEVQEARQGSPLRKGTRGWVQQVALKPLEPENPGP